MTRHASTLQRFHAPTLVSFFAGIGGFDLAFERAGIATVAQVELEPSCQKLLQAHWPNALRLDDITKLNSLLRRLDQFPRYEKFFERLANADVFCGGFPCQDLSVAGQRKGLAGERSGLWFAFRRIIALFRPPWVVIENVPGLLSSQSGDCFRVILSGLEKLGYGVSWRSFDAQYAGLAQRRERVFLVGSLGNLDSAEILFERQSLCWDSPPRRETRERIAPTIEGRAGRSGETEFATSGCLAEVAPPIAGVYNGGGANGPGRTADDAESLVAVTANPIGSHHSRQDLDNDSYVVSAGFQNTGHGWWNQTDVAQTVRDASAGGASHANLAITHALSSEGADASEDGTGRGTPIVLAHGQGNAEMCRDGSPSLTCNHEAPIVFDTTQITSRSNYSNPKNGDPSHPLASGAHAPAIAFSSKDSGNDAAEELAPTLRSQNFKDSHMNGGGQAAIASKPNGGRAQERNIMSAMQVRRLTPLECERLQGFPDGWTAGFSDSVRYRMIGNSVAVPVVEWLARRLRHAIASSK